MINYYYKILENNPIIDRKKGIKKYNYFFLKKKNIFNKTTLSYRVTGPIQFYHIGKNVCFFIYFWHNIFCYPEVLP